LNGLEAARPASRRPCPASGQWPRNNQRLALTTEAAGELEVLGLDGDTLGVNSGKVGVLELEV
jgi:hypothetical protein